MMGKGVHTFQTGFLLMSSKDWLFDIAEIHSDLIWYWWIIIFRFKWLWENVTKGRFKRD